MRSYFTGFLIAAVSVAACSTEADGTGASTAVADASVDTFVGFQPEADAVTLLDTSTGPGVDADPAVDGQTSVPDVGEDTATGLTDALVEPDVGIDPGPEVSMTDAALDDVIAADAGSSDDALSDAISVDVGPEVPADVVQVDAADDAGAPDPDVAQDFPPFAKTTCQKTVNTNTGGTVNPFISVARNGQFYVSWVESGGNLMLTWESPKTCETAAGPFQVNAIDGAVYYWGGIAVVSDNQGNFYAVWESSLLDQDISFAWSETGSTFSESTEIVSTSTNGQEPAIWVAKPGEVHAAWSGHHPDLPQYDVLYAKGTDLFTGGGFSVGQMINEDESQDDQVALVGDGYGKLYVGWQRFDGDIFVSRSVDNGGSWSTPVQVNDVNGMANVGKATFMAITPEGRVVIIWSDERNQKSGNENDVFADSSADGLTWGVDVQVNDDDNRYQEDPALAVAVGGPCAGAVYAVWQDFRGNSSYDVYAARSTDGGLTWSANEAIAEHPEGDEMNPAIAVGLDCTIGVAWRDSVTNASFDIGTTYLHW